MPKPAEVVIQVDAQLAQHLKELTILRAVVKHLLLQQPGHCISIGYADLSAAHEALDATIVDDGQRVKIALVRPEALTV